MAKFNPENALISRRVFSVDQDSVVIHEVWNTKHPDCPFVVANCDIKTVSRETSIQLGHPCPPPANS